MTTDRQKAFSMIPVDYIRSRAEKYDSVVREFSNGALTSEQWKLKK
jgi:hypothetical protein